MSETESAKMFKLSRIRASGWNAGQNAAAMDAGDLSEAVVAKMNPYAIPAERECWLEGFLDATNKSPSRGKRHPIWRKG